MPLFTVGSSRPRLLGSGVYIAHDAHVIGAVEIGHDTSLWFGSVVRGDNDRIIIGSRCNVQDHVVIHTDEGLVVNIGHGVSIGHRALLHGCTVDDGALIGIGAVVLNGAKIGAGSLVGANSLVTEGKEIPPGVLAHGSPAKVIRDLNRDERDSLERIVESYVQKAILYAAEFRPDLTLPPGE
jgi:carbonic anhydrase/acetyltransferase-like protein (isoleucine patch superfamily)